MTTPTTNVNNSLLVLMACALLVIVVVFSRNLPSDSLLRAKPDVSQAFASTTITKEATTISSHETSPPSPPPPLSSSNATKKTSYEMVVTILHSHSESWKHQEKPEQASFLLLPEVENINVTICSPDELIGRNVFSEGLAVKHFRPESDEVFGPILKSNRTGAVTILPIMNGKHAQEVPGYVTYILHHYDALPDVVIFVHADPFGHGHNVLRSIRHVVDNWTPQQIGFLHLNEGNVMCRAGGNGGSWGRFWDILGFNLSHAPKYIKQPCCAQFMVTRERILLRPRYFYQQLLKFTYTLEESAYQEHYWHIFFGESAIMNDDREIKHYLLSNWTRPVKDAVLHNPFPSFPLSDSMKPWYEKSIKDPDSYYQKISDDRSTFCPPGSMY